MKRKKNLWSFVMALLMLPVTSCVSPNEESYPIRVGRDDVKEYSISDLRKDPEVRIEYNRGKWRRSQAVGCQGSHVSHAIEAFLNGGKDREELLAGFHLTGADIDSVRIFFPGETDFEGNTYSHSRLIIYLKRYVKGLQSYSRETVKTSSNPY